MDRVCLKHYVGLLLLIFTAAVLAEVQEDCSGDGKVHVVDSIMIVEDVAVDAEEVSLEASPGAKGEPELVDRARLLGVEVNDVNLFIDVFSKSIAGVYINPKVQLGTRNGLRGLFAMEDIAQDELLAKVPHEYFVAGSAMPNRIQELLEVVKRQVFDEQHLVPGDWINVDYRSWEILVVSWITSEGLANGDDDLAAEVHEFAAQHISQADVELAKKLAMEQRLGERTDDLSPFRFGQSKERHEVASSWFFLGVPPFDEYNKGRGALLESATGTEYSDIEVAAVDWAFPRLQSDWHRSVDRQVYEYLSETFFGHCFTIPSTGEEFCIKQPSSRLFQYLCAIAARYCFSISGIESGQVGYVSLINHGFFETHHWHCDNEFFYLQASFAEVAGSELLISYGGLDQIHSTLHYGFANPDLEMELRHSLYMSHNIPSPVSTRDVGCVDVSLERLAMLPRKFPQDFVIELKPSATHLTRTPEGLHLAQQMRHGQSFPHTVVPVDKFKMKIAQCLELSSEIIIHSPGVIDGKSWQLVRLLNLEPEEYPSFSVHGPNVVNDRVECLAIDSLGMLIETELSLYMPSSIMVADELLLDVVESMTKSLEALEEEVLALRKAAGLSEEVLVSNTIETRYHAVAQVARSVQDKKKLLVAALRNLYDYADSLGC